MEQARKHALELVSQLSAGIGIAQQRKKERSGMSFEDLFNLYYKQHSIPNKITHLSDQQKYDKYIKRSIGNKKLLEMERADIASIHSKITAAGHGTTANRVLSVISAVFGWAVDGERTSAIRIG